ncbi:MAG TPA: ABC transporter permease [Halanaerobiales bacterium]|nr:ABC transporter permease [Halanaerobiales bacterium]
MKDKKEKREKKEISIQSKRWSKFKRNKMALLGSFLILLQVFIAIFAPFLAPYDPYEQNLMKMTQPVGTEGHILGTDNFGRDILSRLIFGSRISLVVGLTSVLFGLFIGVTLGLIAGYYKKLDNIIMRLIDIMLSFPGVLLALAIIAMLGPGLINVIIAISIWSIPTFTRLVRSQVLQIKEYEYVMAAEALGVKDPIILIKHILPNCIGPIIVYATLRIASAILSAAALSFLGLGAQPPLPEWGAMVSAGRSFIYNAPHMIIVPGLAIMMLVLSFNLVGDGLRDAFDPSNLR